MREVNYICPKCGNKHFEADTITTSGGVSKFFDVQNKKFTAVTCSRCKYTEFYKAETSMLENIFDLFSQG